MNPTFAALGLASYLMFYVSLFQLDSWLTNLGRGNAAIRYIAPYCIDGCPKFYLQASPTYRAAITNLLLMAVFAIQHSLMARPAFKRSLASFLPTQLERSAYILASSLSLILLTAFWEPLPYKWFEVPHTIAPLVGALHYLGVAIVLASSFMMDHGRHFGLTQSFSDSADDVQESTKRYAGTTHHQQQQQQQFGGRDGLRQGEDDTTGNRAARNLDDDSQQHQPALRRAHHTPSAGQDSSQQYPALSRQGFYNHIRNPKIVGILLTLWGTPCFTTGRLLLNFILTAYSLAAVRFLEEPELRRKFGEDYKLYHDSVPAYIPDMAALASGGFSSRRINAPNKFATQTPRYAPSARESAEAVKG